MGLLSVLGSVANFAAPFIAKGIDHASASALQSDSQAFQKEFYQNRHQWEVADLRAAGLNPILSATNFSGGTASGGIASTAGMENPATALAALRRTKAETSVLEAQGTSASAKSLVDVINAIRELRTFKKIDESPIGKDAAALVNALPPYLRGVFRFGVGSAGAYESLIKLLKDKVKSKLKNVGPNQSWPRIRGRGYINGVPIEELRPR